MNRIMDNQVTQMMKGDRVERRRELSTFDRQLRSMLSATIATMLANGDREGVRLIFAKLLNASV